MLLKIPEKHGITLNNIFWVRKTVFSQFVQFRVFDSKKVANVNSELISEIATFYPVGVAFSDFRRKWYKTPE